MKFPASLSLLLTAFIVLPSSARETQRFALEIDPVFPLPGSWPVVVGLPFPEDMQPSASEIRLLRDGEAHPVQIDVAATWKSGSVRWALAGFDAEAEVDYTIEFGPGVAREEIDNSLAITTAEDGAFLVDTGVARYSFAPDELLPVEAELDGTPFLAESGGGAYLIDNHGRKARVAGAKAEVESEWVKQGPLRAVLKRSGWYVTPDNERIARARIWFYFAAGHAGVRITHSLVFTEDTNDVWVRDYGLEFQTPTAPSEVRFAIGEPGGEEPVTLDFEGTLEYFMLQDTFPHFLETDSRAVVGKAKDNGEDILRETEVAGDWADATYAEYGITLVIPWLARQFPKEIAVGPESLRAVFWSGRSDRELDFRAATLVNEYWGDWADHLVENADSNVIPWINKYWEEEREPEGAEALARWPSNAQAAARTHDVWLLPHHADEAIEAIEARARTAARAPLALADPVWATATRAIGWPMHPEDQEAFPAEEAAVSEYWDRFLQQFVGLPRTGFIAWGANPLLSHGKLFRHGILADYNLRRSVWGLYLRSGDRRYYDYATRYNRFIADWWIHHWDAGDKFRGGFASPGGYWEGHMPFIWGDRSVLTGDSSGHDVHNFLMHHYLTGDEHPLFIHRMISEAHLTHWDLERVREAPTDARGNEGGLERWEVGMPLRVLSSLYEREWDEEFETMARALSKHLINLDNPNGLSDALSGGALYKWERNVESLYNYYRVTGDEAAQQAIIQALDYHYQFPHQIGGPFGSTNHAAFLYSVAYEWTGNPNYLRVVKDLVDRGVEGVDRATRAPHANAHTTMGLPTALWVLAEVHEPIEPFPLLQSTPAEKDALLIGPRSSPEPLELALSIRLGPDEEPGDTVTVLAHRFEDGEPTRDVGEHLSIEVEPFFETTGLRGDPRRKFLRLVLSPDGTGEFYILRFPGTSEIRVLESHAPVKWD